MDRANRHEGKSAKQFKKGEGKGAYKEEDHVDRAKGWGIEAVQASQQDHAYSPSSAYAVRSEAAASVVALLRTEQLYADRPELPASFVLRDSDGRSLVSSSGLSITVSATGAQGTLTSSSSPTRTTRVPQALTVRPRIRGKISRRRVVELIMGPN